MTLWALFCQWRIRRHVAATERWQRRYEAARAALEPAALDDAKRQREKL
jgi:hypothetical protein